MVSSHAHPQHPALHTNRPHPPVISNKGVLHFGPFAKYAVAFPRMSRSTFTRANSARKRLISICSALTLLVGPFSRPSRCALTQLYNVCSTTPRLRAAAAMLWPDSTIRTASCLNSSVYCARIAFVISLSLLYLITQQGIRFARARSCFDGFGKSFQPIHAGDKDILHPAVL